MIDFLCCLAVAVIVVGVLGTAVSLYRLLRAAVFASDIEKLRRALRRLAIMAETRGDREMEKVAIDALWGREN